MVGINSWAQIIEYVLRLPHQQDVRVPKESVVHPQTAGIPYSGGAYRFTARNGRAIDIKDCGDYYLVHWDWYNPATHLIEHALYDAPEWWLLGTALTGAAVGAMSSEKGQRGKGAVIGGLAGLGFGLFILFLREIAREN